MERKTVYSAFQSYLDNRKYFKQRKLELAASLIGFVDNPQAYSLAIQDYDGAFKLLEIDQNNLSYLSEKIESAILGGLSSYTNKKLNAVEIYLDLLEYLSDHYNFEFNDKFIESLAVPQQREWTIIKMSCEGKNVSEIAERLFTSERTIRDDLEHLTQEGLVFMDQRIPINGMTYHRAHLNFESTPHPVLLMGNLTEVFIMLNSLRLYTVDSNSKIPSQIAANIWSQLSDYARTTILKRIKNGKLKSDLEWFELLEGNDKGSKQTFQTEMQMSHGNIPDRLLVTFKGSEQCSLVYLDEEEEEVTLPLTWIRLLDGNSASFVEDPNYPDRTIKIQFDRIISCEPINTTR